VASIKDWQRRLEVLEAETAGYGCAKFITFATLYSTGEILSASVDGQTVERLNAETDQDFRARLMKQYVSPETLTVSGTHYAKPKVMDIVYVEPNGSGEPVEKADNPDLAIQGRREVEPVVPAPVSPDPEPRPAMRPSPRPALRDVVEIKNTPEVVSGHWMN
jgi:hypothetical protein